MVYYDLAKVSERILSEDEGFPSHASMSPWVKAIMVRKRSAVAILDLCTFRTGKITKHSCKREKVLKLFFCFSKDVTLKELIDEDDILQECKAQNRKLIDL